MSDADARPDMHLDGRLLLLRADATTEGGTGHLMRTLALAQAWIDAGGRARWLVAEAPPALVDRIAAEGVPIVRVSTRPGAADDAAGLRAALDDDPAAMAVVDGEPFRSAYLTALGSVAARVLVIDDMADRGAYPVGFVLNQNAHADRTSYPADARARFLLGIRYVLLRREFAAAPPPRATPDTARHVLVTFGGADPTGMTARTIVALRLLPAPLRAAIVVRVLVGAADRDSDRIQAAAADPDLGVRVLVERGVADMPARMAWADLAITSGGSTVWELARTGCPAIVVETVSAERLLVSGLVRLGLFESLGPEAGLDPRRLADAVAAKAQDVAWRVRMTSLGMDTIDGGGARRVVRALVGGSAGGDGQDAKRHEERT